MAWDGRLSQIDEDAQVMRQVAAGDAAACRQVMRLWLPQVYRYALRLTGSTAEAEDVAQDALVRLWRQAPNWEPRARLSTWLYRVAYTLSIDRLRRTGPGPLDDAAMDIADTAPGPSAALQERDRTAMIDAALSALPERQRAAIVLVHYQQMSGNEAAAVLDVSVEALESLLSRGRRALRTALAGNKHELMEGGDEAGTLR
jgi:RNA polymerase sigma-70 factor, ECF subfamily